jgi:hypothetical protein
MIFSENRYPLFGIRLLGASIFTPASIELAGARARQARTWAETGAFGQAVDIIDAACVMSDRLRVDYPWTAQKHQRFQRQALPWLGSAAARARMPRARPQEAGWWGVFTESADEILSDKAVALTAREVLKYRDVWDVWFLVNKLNAHADRRIVARKFADYGTSDVAAKAEQRLDDLAKSSSAKSFLDEMKRFLPAKRVAEIRDAGLHQTILAASGELIRRAVLSLAPE